MINIPQYTGQPCRTTQMPTALLLRNHDIDCEKRGAYSQYTLIAMHYFSISDLAISNLNATYMVK